MTCDRSRSCRHALETGILPNPPCRTPDALATAELPLPDRLFCSSRRLSFNERAHNCTRRLGAGLDRVKRSVLRGLNISLVKRVAAARAAAGGKVISVGSYCSENSCSSPARGATETPHTYVRFPHWPALFGLRDDSVPGVDGGEHRESCSLRGAQPINVDNASPPSPATPPGRPRRSRCRRRGGPYPESPWC